MVVKFEELVLETLTLIRRAAVGNTTMTRILLDVGL